MKIINFQNFAEDGSKDVAFLTPALKDGVSYIYYIKVHELFRLLWLNK
ncbi:MAG: hypothetical protein HY738_17500 [Bacteroidia bacterium]|nr:hypothetical protein [Bacteroidia bacterium]